MPDIRLLDSHVIDHIAAGEVVERPASVVKELLENALDAGAQAVEIDLTDGGLGAIGVADDGHGMTADNARRCILRHATSKLCSAEQLFCLQTLGFRGEALSSIAAVSDLTVITRPQAALEGVSLHLRGGQVVAEGPVGCPPGTTIHVRDLFFNTPARRKFMRAPATEQAHAVEAATRVMLGHAHGGVLVRSGTRRLLDIPHDARGAARVMAALGPRVGILHPFAAEVEQVQVEGFMSAPELDRGDTRGLWLFVNGRFIRDKLLQRAMVDVCRRILQPGRYPTVILHVHVRPEDVDVNVHPQKLEVRFAHGASVYRAVVCALNALIERKPWQASLPMPLAPQALARSAPPSALRPEAPGARPTWASRPEAPTARPARGPLTALPEAPAQAPRQADLLPPTPAQAPRQAGLLPPMAAPQARRIELLGGLLDRYFVGRSAAGLVLVDWVALAAQEALLQLQDEACHPGVRRTPLLLPEVLEAQGPWATWLETAWESLTCFGFELEPVAPGRYAVRAIPEALQGAPPGALALTCIEAAFAQRAALHTEATRTHVFTRCTAHLRGLPDLDVAQAVVADLDLQHAAHGVLLDERALARLVRAGA